MPKNTNYIVAIIIIIVLITIGSSYFAKKPQQEILNNQGASSTQQDGTVIATTTSKPTSTGTSLTKVLTTGNIAGFYSYTNAPYNFSLQYPSYVKPLTSFSTFHEIGNNWRLYPGQANQGKSVVSFSIHTIDQGSYSGNNSTYPLYFTAEVRIGVSPNTKECYTKDSSYPNEKVTDVTINGVAFKRFSTSDAGMMKYTQAESYRTIHNNQCYVIEQIKSGTIYRDEKMKIALTDAQLTTYYNLGEKVVKTFKFTK